MRLERLNTCENTDVFSQVKTQIISIEICHEDSDRRLCIPEFEAPAHWSKRACEHLAHHYLRRTGVPAAILRVAEAAVPEWMWRSEEDTMRLKEMPKASRYGPETSYRQVVHRLVGAWCYWGWTNGYFDTEADAKSFYDEMAYLIVMQMAMPASPQWSNTGLHWAYGITGDPQGSVYIDAQNGELMQSRNAYERPQHHHCFIQGVRDDLSGEGGITDLWQREMRVFKHGSGSGCNMSNIRGAGETLSNGMRPAGLVPFMDISEKAAQTLSAATQSNNMRSKLSLIDCDHPDLLGVLNWRLSEHRQRIAHAIGTTKQRAIFQKIHSAIRHFMGSDTQRYNPTINSELGEVIDELRQHDIADTLVMQYINELQSCAGQLRSVGEHGLQSMPNQERTVSQLGVRVSDDFMRAANSNGSWSFKHRTNEEGSSSAPANGLLDEMAYLNWLTGDLTLQFADSVEFWNGCKATTPVHASSPGSEFLFLNDSACDVAVINLAKYLSDDGSFNVAAFEHTVRLQSIMCDIAITMAQFPSADVAYNSYRYRPVGLSFCNLSALLMAMGYAYDSAEGRAIAAAIASLMTGCGYVTSAEIARELGSFEAFSEVRESMMQLMWQHHEAAFGRTQHLGTADICPSVIDHSDLPDSALSDAIQKVWDLAMIKGDEFGYSNAQISLVAESPNMMVLMDAMTSGVSPLMQLNHQQSGAKAVGQGLQTLGYSGEQIEIISHYIYGHQSLFGAPGINQQALRDCGFTDTELTLVEEALQSGQNVHMAFDPLHLGEKFCRETLKLNDDQLHNADFKLLHHLGFDDDALAAFEQHMNGHETVVGAPYLRSEDYAIFALANPQTERPISVEAQIQMTAAVQPYISGGIAHSILTPSTADIKDHRRYMMMAWQLGLKHIELKRQESQSLHLDVARSAGHAASAEPAQPLAHNAATSNNSASTTAQVRWDKLAIEKSEIIGMIKLEIQQLASTPIAQQAHLQPTKAPAPTHMAAASSSQPTTSAVMTSCNTTTPPATTTSSMPATPAAPAAPSAPANPSAQNHRATQRALPNRRRGYVQEAQIGDTMVRHRVEEYEDGSLGVIHLELPDSEVNLQQALQQSAQVLSIALQHGVPIEAFESLVSQSSYGPHGSVTGHQDVSQVQSVMDYLLQDVLPHYQEQLAPAQNVAQISAQDATHTPLRDILNLAETMTDQHMQRMHEDDKVS